MAACTEPGGRDRVPGTARSAHDVLVDETGECPWCGQGEVG